jgi:two-component system, NarL family, sensor histidine kinase DesK
MQRPCAAAVPPAHPDHPERPEGSRERVRRGWAALRAGEDSAFRVAGSAEERRGFIVRWRLFAGIFLVYLAAPVVELWRHDAIYQRIVGVGLLAAFVVLYLAVVPAIAFGSGRRRRAVTAVAMTLVVVVYLIVCGTSGLVMVPYLAVALALLLDLLRAIRVILLLSVATLLVPQHVPGWTAPGLQWELALPAVLASAVMVVLRINAGTHGELVVAEREIERLAAEQERLRIARDLHDLLGHALTTMTMKAELAARLIEREPARAAAEMVEVAALSRQSLADVRATVAGYREVSLATELATAREVLQAAGIEVELPASTEDVAGDLRELFGWALREGVTNAMRHSHAHHLTVRLGARSIEVVNDGATDPGTNGSTGAGWADGKEVGGKEVGGKAAGGSGLAGLSERAAELGGRVEAGPDGPTGYRLRVDVPA